MHKVTKFVLVVCGLSMLNGCVIVARDYDSNGTNWEKQEGKNRDMITQLSLQMERSDVIEKMGLPSFSEALIKQGDQFRVLYYRTQKTKSDGETTKDETTPLVFKNDKLIGWGAEALKFLG